MVLYGTQCPQARGQAYHLLALAAQEVWGLSQLPPLTRRPGGKPYFPQHPELEFNLSHSGQLILCALDSAPVGVDIQQICTMRPGLPARVCSPQQLAWLEEGELWPRFAQIWALKEALVKYTGTGLTRSIPGIQVPLLPKGETLSQQDGLWFRVYQGDGWMGAACGTVPPPESIRWVTLPTVL